ncbi:FK506-binding protein 5-like [Asparagus officinalis]|uniref:FK506-binding protein 5-like n=1 Tax=Asparagus officinalis TaxID=4686 RepID=UPI00098E0084|nr:FK506-binding protein 5-like [Asparagus officinalis]
MLSSVVNDINGCLRQGDTTTYKKLEIYEGTDDLIDLEDLKKNVKNVMAQNDSCFDYDNITNIEKEASHIVEEVVQIEKKIDEVEEKKQEAAQEEKEVEKEEGQEVDVENVEKEKEKKEGKEEDAESYYSTKIFNRKHKQYTHEGSASAVVGAIAAAEVMAVEVSMALAAVL